MAIHESSPSVSLGDFHADHGGVADGDPSQP